MRRLLPLSLSFGLVLGVLFSPSPLGAVVTPPIRAVVNLSHAGGDFESPHSTMYAMRRAVAAGVDVLDMDLRLSADGVIMVQHDDTVDRTTGDSGPVTSFTAAQLGAMDNAHWFIPNCWSCRTEPPEAYTLRGIRTGGTPAPAGYSADDFGIASLDDVVTAFPNKRYNVEIKDGIPGAEALAAYIATHGPADRWVVVAFDSTVMEHFRSLAPDVPVGPGVDTVTAWFGSRGPLPGYAYLQVPPVYSGIEVVTPQFVADAHAAGLKVWVWFNGAGDDVPAEWQRLLAMGVDGLNTARPAAAEPYIAAANAARAAATTTTTSTVPVAAPSGLPATGGSAVPAVLGVLSLGAGLAMVRPRRRR
ncbi:MAG: glycerophosphodiester phosphodiesterase family protein [Actinomycetes bacterium]